MHKQGIVQRYDGAKPSTHLTRNTVVGNWFARQEDEGEEERGDMDTVKGSTAESICAILDLLEVSKGE